MLTGTDYRIWKWNSKSPEGEYYKFYSSGKWDRVNINSQGHFTSVRRSDNIPLGYWYVKGDSILIIGYDTFYINNINNKKIELMDSYHYHYSLLRISN